MVSWKLKALRGKQRRDFLKLMVAASAGLGIERSGLLNYINDVGGSGLAEAAIGKSSRALMVTCGNGVYGWMQELWPHVEVGTNLTSNKMAYLYTTGHGYNHNAAGNSEGYHLTDAIAKNTNDRHFVYSPDAPWRQNPNMPMSASNKPKYNVTGIMAGNDETHTLLPRSAAIVSGGADLPATVAAIQGKLGAASIVPVIGIDPLIYGTAKGAPNVVTVPNAQGMVDLFNSSASQVTLATDEDRLIFETYYNALVGLRRSAPRSSWEPQLAITKEAAHLIGINYGELLQPSQQDLDDFGVSELQANTKDLFDNQRNGLIAFARTLISVAKAFRINLTTAAIVGLSPSPTSDSNWVDPHVTFSGGTNKARGRNTTMYLGKALDAFYAELAKEPEGGSTDTMADNTVFMTWGDTPHNPCQGQGWPDATPKDSNWLYVMDPKEHIKGGWFGQVHADQNVSGFDPVTGTEAMNIASTATSAAAGAAAAYCVAKGDWNTVAEHYVGPKIEAMLKS